MNKILASLAFAITCFYGIVLFSAALSGTGGTNFPNHRFLYINLACLIPIALILLWTFRQLSTGSSPKDRSTARPLAVLLTGLGTLTFASTIYYHELLFICIVAFFSVELYALHRLFNIQTKDL
jgi:hypothetical protein